MVLVGALFSTLSKLNNTTTTATTTTTLSSGARAEELVIIVIILVVTTVLGFLLYAYATRSHVNTIAPFASAPTLARAVSGRRFVLFGAIVVAADLAELVVPYGGLVGLVPTILFVYGYREIRAAFDEVSRPAQIAPHPGRSTGLCTWPAPPLGARATQRKP